MAKAARKERMEKLRDRAKPGDAGGDMEMEQ